MEWTTIIVALISSIGASAGITSLVTMKEKKKEKQLENKEKDIENKDKEDSRWERLADQLEAQIGKLNEQISDLNMRLEKKDALLQEKDDIISDLRERLDKSRSKCVASDLMKCIKISCQDREPKIGTRYVDVEQIVEDTEK